MLKILKKTFINGLVALLPIIITIALIVWTLGFIENFFGYIIRRIIGDQNYLPGLGIVLGLIMVFLAGAFLNAWTIKKFYHRVEELMKRIPFIKTLYGSVRDLMNFFGDKNRKKGTMVVMVTIANTRLMGIVTKENFEDSPPGLGMPDEVAVYLPMSYQIGGYTILIPRSHIHPIDMSVEEAMRFTVTAGMVVTQTEAKAKYEKKQE